MGRAVLLLLFFATAVVGAIELDSRSFLLAAARGDAIRLQAFLDAGIPVDVQDSEGNTALMLAARGGHRQAVQMLLRHRADPSLRNLLGETALVLAGSQALPLLLEADQEREPVLRRVLLQGESDLLLTVLAATTEPRLHRLAACWVDDPKVRGQILQRVDDKPWAIAEAQQVLFSACAAGRPDLARLALEHGADPAATAGDRTLIEVASLGGSAEVLKLLRADQADPARLTAALKLVLEPPRWRADGNRLTGSVLRLPGPQAEVVKYLLAAGADSTVAAGSAQAQLLLQTAQPESVGPDGYGPLRRLLEKPFTLEQVRALLNAGVEVEQVADDGTTPLMRAAEIGGAELLALLLQHQAQADTADLAGWTSLHHFVSTRSGELASLVLLVEAGVDVNRTTLRGETALSLCLENNPYETGWITYLIEQGASIELGAPLVGLNDISAVAVLLRHGANPEQMDRLGRTALMTTSSLEVARRLLAAGARVDTVDPEGCSALHYHSRRGDAQMVELLLRAGASPELADRWGRRPADFCPQAALRERLAYRGEAESQDTPQAAAGTAQHLIGRGKFEEALQVCERAEKLNAEGLALFELLKIRLSCLTALKDYSQAIEVMSQLESLARVSPLWKAHILQALGRRDEAVAALQVGLRHQSGERLQLSYHFLSELYQQMDQPAKASAYREKVPSDLSWQRLYCQRLVLVGDSPAAIETYESLLSQPLKLLEATHCRQALAQLYMARGWRARALVLLRENLESAVSEAARVDALFTLSYQHYLMRQYAEALEFALRLEGLAALEPWRKAESETLLGIIYQDLGMSDEALEHNQRALKLARQLTSEQATTTKTVALHNLAESHLRLGDEVNYQKAESLVREALSYSDRLPLTSQAYLWAKLGRLEARRFSYAKARQHLSTALVLARQGGMGPLERQVLIQLGDLAWSQENFEEAERRWQEVADLIDREQAPESRAILLQRRGKAALRRGELQLALELLQQAASLFDQVSEGLGTRERKAFLSEHESLYDQLLQVHAGLKQSEQAFETSERARSRAFLDLLANSGAGLRERVPLKALVEEEALLADIEALEGKSDKASQEKLKKLKADHARHVRGYRAHQRLPEVEVEGASAFRAELARGQLLLEYYLGEKEAHLLLVDRQGVQVVSLGDSQEISRLVRRLRRLLLSPDSSTDEVLRSLSQKLLAPVAQRLVDCDSLVVVPHHELHYLPFQVLPLKGEPLLSQATIELAPSANAWLLSRRRQVQGRGVLAAALGNYQPGSESQPAESSRPGTVRWARERGLEMAPLPGTLKEVEAIRRLFPAAAIYVEAEMKSRTLKEQAADSRILHLATHGILDADVPLYSGLLMADQLLTISELFDWKLSAELTVLSACNTASGKLGKGDEMVGLTRAFLHAGSKSVLATLWPVSDEATSLWMATFYRELSAGTARARAARQASLELRQRHPHPYYWAPFVLLGDGR